MNEQETANYLKKVFGNLALKVAQEILHNNPHKVSERYFVDSKGEKTDESYTKTIDQSNFWIKVCAILK